MLMKITGLAPGDARAVYKNTTYDMRQYKRLQMFVHAEKLINDEYNLKDNELTCFIRIGSDMVNNYYEYEVPLMLTPHGIYSSSSTRDREVVWHPDNMIDFPFEALTEVKLRRNKAKGNSQAISNLTPFTVADPKKPRNSITVVGNPTIAEVENIMIGVRNRSNNLKSAEVWVNELRMSQFNEESGWAALANLALGLSDLGSINLAGRVETAGYGSLESNVMERRNDRGRGDRTGSPLTIVARQNPFRQGDCRAGRARVGLSSGAVPVATAACHAGNMPLCATH